MPRTVSVVIPVYNAQETIGKCLDSIIGQDYQPIEIIAINDGSTDDSLAVLQRYAATNANLVVIDTPNQGVSKTRDNAIAIATGEFLAFVDCDDYIDPDYVTTYMGQMDDNHDIVIGGWRRVDGQGKLMFERSLGGSEWESYINVYAWSKLYRRDFLVANNVQFLDYGIGEDVYFAFTTKAKHARVKIISYVGYTWTNNATSVSNTSHKGLNQNLDVLHLLGKINSLFQNKPELLRYYYRRFLVWWLLYSGRQATREEFLLEHRRVMAWIDDNRVRTSLTPFSPRLAGETLFERLSVFAFSALERFHLLGPFAFVYCKG
ncbi:MAG: glycosyltransferase [Propionibacteriaceae bacterium]|nr:glycosyltransferase [Propionibacteriaceae bacterium]